MFGAPTSSRMTSNGPCSSKPSGSSALTSSAEICSRACSSRTVAVTRAPAIVPSCTAAMPTPPAAPCTRSRSPDVRLAWVNSASCAVVKTSGTPPAAFQLELLGDGHRRRLVHDGELGLAAAGDDRHHAVAGLEAADGPAAIDHLARQLKPRDVLRRAGRRRVAPGQLEHVGPVEPRGLHADEQLPRLRARIGVLLDGDRPLADGGGAHVRRSLHRATFEAIPGAGLFQWGWSELWRFAEMDDRQPNRDWVTPRQCSESARSRCIRRTSRRCGASRAWRSSSPRCIAAACSAATAWRGARAGR